MIFGPTLLDLADHLGVGVGDLAAMFACRAIGAAIGSVCSGIALDKLFHSTYIILTLILLSSLASKLINIISNMLIYLGCFGCLDQRDRRGSSINVSRKCAILDDMKWLQYFLT